MQVNVIRALTPEKRHNMQRKSLNTGCKRYRLPKKYVRYISVYLSEKSNTILFYLVL